MDDDSRCGLCGRSETDVLHAPIAHPRRRRVLDGIRQHGWLPASKETASDGHSPKRGSMQLPGWEPLDEISGVPMAEAYAHHARGLLLWREPRTYRWRWGRVDRESGVKTYAVASRTWLHEALAEAVRQ